MRGWKSIVYRGGSKDAKVLQFQGNGGRGLRREESRWSLSWSGNPPGPSFGDSSSIFPINCNIEISLQLLETYPFLHSPSPLDPNRKEATQRRGTRSPPGTWRLSAPSTFWRSPRPMPLARSMRWRLPVAVPWMSITSSNGMLKHTRWDPRRLPRPSSKI